MKIICTKHAPAKAVKASSQPIPDIQTLQSIAKSSLSYDAGSVSHVYNFRGEQAFNIYENDVGNYYVFLRNGVADVYLDDGTSAASCGSLQKFRQFIQQINNGYAQIKDEASGKYSANASTSIKAADLEFDFDEDYLMQLADMIEELLLTDFDVEATAYVAGDSICITSDIDDDQAYEAVITQADFAGLTGDLETDAYPFAEEYYSNM